MLLGAVWSPCMDRTRLRRGFGAGLARREPCCGPQRYAEFCAGVVHELILALATGARAGNHEAVRLRWRVPCAKGAAHYGSALCSVGIGRCCSWCITMAEAWAVQNLPAWLIDFSVSL